MEYHYIVLSLWDNDEDRSSSKGRYTLTRMCTSYTPTTTPPLQWRYVFDGYLYPKDV